MMGSFETPPIVIRTSRTFSFIGFAVCSALAGLGLAPVFLGQTPFRIDDHLQSITLGLFALYFAWQLISPMSLILSPAGLIWKNGFAERSWAWRDVSNFRVMLFACVGCDISDRGRPMTSWLRSPNKLMTGSQGSFGFGWKGGAAAVVATLAAARSRWIGMEIH